MARLTRVYQKVFASNAANNGVFGSLQAGNPTTSNDVATLQSLSAFENGWDDAIEQGDKLPPLEEFQGIQYGISYQQAYILQEGIAEWEANTPYYKGSLAKTISGSSFKLYCSLADNNTGNVVTNTTYWKLVMDSDDVYALNNEVVHIAGSEAITGTKTFANAGALRVSVPVTYGTAPASDTQGFLEYVDNNGNRISLLGTIYQTTGQVYQQMAVKKPDGSNNYAQFLIGYDANQAEFVNASSGVKGVLDSWGMPNWSGAVSFTSGSTASSNGFLKIKHLESKTSTVSVGGTVIYTHTWGGGDFGLQYFETFIPIAKGNVVTYTEMEAVTFYPCIGG